MLSSNREWYGHLEYHEAMVKPTCFPFKKKNRVGSGEQNCQNIILVGFVKQFENMCHCGGFTNRCVFMHRKPSSILASVLKDSE